MEDIGDAVENPVALRFVTPFTEVTGLVAYILHIFRKIKIKISRNRNISQPGLSTLNLYDLESIDL